MEKQELTQELIKAISDPSEWQRALGSLCRATGADRALIALRHRDSADIVIPETIAEQHNGPLIYGFTDDEVGAYLYQFAKIDPWTAIEKANHPYFPYALSRHISLEELHRTPFWNWLEPMKIDDSIVCEISSRGEYWTSLNLYFGGTSPEKADRIRERLKDVLGVLRAVWDSSREVQLAKAKETSLDVVFAQIGLPAMILGADGTIEQISAAMAEIGEQALGQPPTIGARLVLPQDMELVSNTDDLPFKVKTSSRQTGYEGRAMISVLDRGQLTTGEPSTNCVLTLSADQNGPRSAGDLLWEAPSLTERERTLVRMIAVGSILKDAAVVMGISRQRVMQLWKSAREKLSVSDTNELRFEHKLRKKNR